jgi:peptidyl-tRNA hydrolase
MSPGKIAAQSVHAALGLAQVDNRAFSPMHSVVVLDASDKKFEEAKTNFPNYVVKDKGITEVAPGTETVLAILEV